ncbi:hypothetical protein H0274_01165 [Altererythrobacter sp. CC-YST694]|uniref:hypothetical protein n=1 Tax=Altererythrobacter sp. CC-YST694 TaxID=2755038 RepID=UPI001D0263B9|nr:hypothetical protein [Altererythrobacter sp. CC-YST694]MCB5423852.1 hypothetical protein [Altererythrobacter sp. CC-YST694]
MLSPIDHRLEQTEKRALEAFLTCDLSSSFLWRFAEHLVPRSGKAARTGLAAQAIGRLSRQLHLARRLGDAAGDGQRGKEGRLPGRRPPIGTGA